MNNYQTSKENGSVTGRCKVCRVSFTLKAVRRRARTESHFSKTRANLRSSTVDNYFMKTGKSEEQEESALCRIRIDLQWCKTPLQLFAPRLRKFTLVALCVYRF
jgi:hypothetical protein